MEIKFETVRVGKFRKDMIQERILKENFDHLKNNIKDFVKNIQGKKIDEIIYVDIVIPARGSQIAITLDSIKDEKIKQLLIKNFPDSIYKADYSILENNCHNEPYFPFKLLTKYRS